MFFRRILPAIGKSRIQDLQNIQGWFQRGEMLGGLWLPEREYWLQDSLGTPVTADGQVVGVWNSVVPATLGTELVTNGTFNSSTSPWDAGIVSPANSMTRTVESGRMKVTTTTNLAYGYAIQIINAKANRRYRFRATCEMVSTPFDLVINNANGFSNTLVQYRHLTPGVRQHDITIATGSSPYIMIVFAFESGIGSNVDGVAYIDDVSLQQYVGAYGIQSTTANKPLTDITPQTQLPWLTADATDVVPVVFTSALGSSCTIARATPTGAEFAESQTVNATWNDLARPYQYNSAVFVSNTPLSAYQKAVVTRMLGRYVPVLGVNVALNPGMDADANWTSGTGWSIGSGVATKSAGTASTLVQTIAASGKTYFVNADLTRTAGTIGIMDGSATQRAAYSAAGALSNTVVAAGTSIGLSSDASFAGTADNVTVREVS